MKYKNKSTHAYDTNSTKGSSYEPGPNIWTSIPNIKPQHLSLWQVIGPNI